MSAAAPSTSKSLIRSLPPRALKAAIEAHTRYRQGRPGGTRANLSYVDLDNVNLEGVDLSEADLRGADLRGTNLGGANLSSAHLDGANFFKAVLDGADLAGAFLNRAQFLNCAQLIVAQNWQSTFRDDALACGASIPDRMPSE